MSQGDAASYAEPAGSANAGRARQRLTSETLSILGVGIALATLMLTGYAGLRADLRDLRGELIDYRAETHAQFEALRGEMDGLAETLRGEMDGLAETLRGEMNALASELRGEMHALATELRGEMRALARELRAELGAIREDVAGLREEVGDLRRDVATLREEVETIKADTVIRTQASPALSVGRAGGARVGPQPAVTTPAAPRSWT